MLSPNQPPSLWASNFATVCNAVGSLAVNLAQAGALILGSLAAREAARRLDDIVSWLPPIA